MSNGVDSTSDADCSAATVADAERDAAADSRAAMLVLPAETNECPSPWSASSSERRRPAAALPSVRAPDVEINK